MLCSAIFGTTLWAGFNLFVAIGCYLVIGGVTAGTLLYWGSPVIEVTAGELRAGRARLPLSQVGDVAELDEAQARALRGPRADPSAYLLIRPYLKLALYVQVLSADPARPYWLIGTRRPAELAAAIQRSRPQSRARGSSVG